MQIIRASRDAILSALGLVARVAESRSPVPILSHVLIEKHGEEVSFVANDTEIQARTTAQIGSGNEPGSATMSAAKLLSILRALPEGPDVSISVTDSKASIRSGRSRFAVQTLDADDYPKLSVSDDFKASFTMPQKQLKHLFHMVHFAMAQKDVRYYLNGLLLETDANAVRVVATDGHRLAYCEAAIDGQAIDRNQAIIPRKTVLELLRLLKDDDSPVLIDVASNQVRFRVESVEIISKLIDGRFPDYHRVIPTSHLRQMTAQREPLAAALSRAFIFTSDKFRGVRLSTSSGLLKIQTSNADQEEAVEELEVDYADDPLEIAFNVAYLMDVLGNLKTDQIVLEFGSEKESALMTLPDDPSFRYVLMPMRM